MREDFLKKYGPWALITGASSGIGDRFARRLAEKGFNLVLAARREARLNKLAAELSTEYGVEARAVAVDLSSPDFSGVLANATSGLDIGLLVNNAGFAVTGPFLEHDLKDEVSLLDVNCRAPLVLSHHYGKPMVARGSGGIINISSASAIMPIPFWANYSSSKVYLLHFSEALWYELKSKGVDVVAVCPGSTDTEFSQVAGVDMPCMPADKVVDRALAKLGKAPSVTVGALYAVSDFVVRFMSRRLAVRLGSKATGWNG